MRSTFARKRSVLLVAALFAVLSCGPAWAAKNVILMVADGAGFNVYNAASMYQGKWDASSKQRTQVYDGPGWVKFACSTYPLNTSKKPQGTGTQDSEVVYDPAKAWDKEQGYEWLKARYADSAAAATALSTGQKTFNNAINWSDLDKPQGPTMTEAAKAAGKGAGVITTVEWSHATPAGLSNAHVAERDEYESIAKQMLEGGVLDVIMGAGNPDFDNNAKPWQAKKQAAGKDAAKADSTKTPDKSKDAAKQDKQGGKTSATTEGTKAKDSKKDEAKEDKQEFKYVGGQEVWKAIEEARRKPGGTYLGFRPVSTKAEFEALVSGPTPAKVLGTAQAATTLQQARAAGKSDNPAEDTPLNAGVPDLATMVRGAINVLDEQPKGFFLLVEGGAVDWANHRNQPGRMLQEQSDFNRAVEAVVQWVEKNSNWDETLLIVTADHETGLLWGPESDTKPFDPVVDHGPGKVPGLKYNAKNHTNSLVPVFARGAGSETLARMVVGKDPVRGEYIDNTSIGKVLQAAIKGETLGAAKPAAGKRGEGARPGRNRRPARQK